MTVVQDIIDNIAEIAQSLVDNAISKLLKIVISGYTLLFSAPAIALGSLFNDEVGYVDPLLLTPLETFTGKFFLCNFDAQTLHAVKSGFYLRMPVGIAAYRIESFILDDYTAGLVCTEQVFTL